MKKIPEEYVEPIKGLLEWNLEEFPRTPLPQGESAMRLERLLDNLCKQNFEMDNNTVYFLRQAVEEAINDIERCGVEEKLLWEIREWINKP